MCVVFWFVLGLEIRVLRKLVLRRRRLRNRSGVLHHLGLGILCHIASYARYGI